MALTLRASRVGRKCFQIIGVDSLAKSLVSLSCHHCGGKCYSGTDSTVFSLSPSCHSQVRTFSTSQVFWRKDFYREDRLPIYDYGKINVESKRLYVFGQAGNGALGLANLCLKMPEGEDTRRRVYMQRPSRHGFSVNHEVRDIAAGHGFTLIAIKPKKGSSQVIFGCGYNGKSQLGFQPSPKNKPMACLISVVPLSLPLDSSSTVLALGAGRGHSLISLAGKGVLALGDNSYGQCGRKVIEDEEYMGSKYICRIPALGPSHDYDVVDITAGVDVSIFLTKMGNVYTFGCNDQGQLGRGKVVDKPWVPVEVGGDLKDVRVTKVASSGASVLAVSDKGQLFGWGSNDCGQVNPETHSNIYYEPIHIKMPRRIGKIIDVAIGDMCTFVLNEYGNVYVWGLGGSLGLGPKNTVVKTPTLMPPPLFGRNEFSPDTSVVKIASSSKYAAAVNSIGDLYTWGKNEDGCLGLGKLHRVGDYQCFPLKVAIGVPVHKVCLGADHTVLLTKGGC